MLQFSVNFLYIFFVLKIFSNATINTSTSYTIECISTAKYSQIIKKVINVEINVPKLM